MPYILGFVAALAALFVCGRFLRETYSGGAQALIAAPIDDVWARVSDGEKHPIGGRMVRAVTRNDDGWIEDLGSSQVTVRLGEVDAPNRVVRNLTDSVVPMTARNVVTLKAVDGGTQVDVTHEVTIRLGTWHSPIFRWVMLLTNAASSAPRDWLKGLNKP